MSASMEVMPPGGHETYATSIFSKIKTYLDSNPYKPVKDVPNTPTAIATFTDGSALPMPKLEVAIEPQQDLHGYDSPWIGGAGKNKLKYPYYASSTTLNGVTFTVNDDGTVNVNGTATADASFYLAYTGSDMVLPQGEYTLNGCPSGGSNTTYMLNITNVSTQDIGSGANFTSDGTTSLNIRIIVRANTTVSNLLFKPMIRLASVTDATFEPYSNICPIIGWDEVNVGVSGKNLCKSTIHGYVSSTDGLIIIDNDTESAIFYAREGQTYTISSSATMNKSRVALVGTDNVVNYTPILQRETLTDNINTWTATWTGWSVWYKCSSRQTAFDNSAQVELGSTATSYEPYNEQTYTIDLDGTRYGGTLDVVSGVMTVNRASIKLNDLNWIKQNTVSGNWRFISSQSIQNIKLPTDASRKIDNLCSVYQTVTANETWTAEKTGIAINADGKLIICDLNQADTTALDVVIANQTYCYELATPLTIQLTPTAVKSLLGSNNVWADTGDVLDAEYIRDMYDNITAKYAAYAYNSGSADTASKLGSSNVGSATQPIYLNGGTATACTYTLGKSVPSNAVFTDTKNTAGSTDTSSKIFLIGATSQAANPQTYSHDTAYVGTDGCLYSGGTKVLTAHQDISGKADKSATVSTVTWSNNKLTKTINGTTSDVVSASDILDNLTSSQVTTALGYIPGPSYSFESSDDSIDISSSMVPGNETINLKLNSVSWNNISGKPSTFAPSAHDHTYLASAGTNTQSTSSTAYALGSFNVRWFTETGKIPHQPSQYGFLLTTATGTNSVENHQIFMAQPNGDLYHRGTNASSSSNPPAFKTILDSSNYTSYTRNSSGVIKVNSVTKTPTNAGTSLASPKPLIDSGYKFLCWLYVQSNGYIVGANYPGGAANSSATWWFANGYLANYGLTFYYLEIKDTI